MNHTIASKYIGGYNIGIFAVATLDGVVLRTRHVVEQRLPELGERPLSAVQAHVATQGH